jgi:hypothetical protein
MRRLPMLSLVIGGCAAAVIATSGAPITAAPDTTPPTLNVPTFPAFVVGNQISVAYYPDENPFAWYTTNIKERLRWDANDPSGICGYDVARSYGGQPDSIVLSRTSATTFTDTMGDYDGSLGAGGSVQDGWDITAYDCAGNSTTHFMWGLPNVVQDDGLSATVYPYQPPSYSGSWSTVSCTCLTGHSAHRTSVKGAGFRITADYPRPDNHLGLVMTKGPAWGRAKVYVDHKYRTTINTYATRTRNRVVVWQTWLPAGTHTVGVFNLATPGHRWLRFDAYLTNVL